MQIRNSLDDILPRDVGEALGRLLIDFQELEAAIRSALDLAFAPIDPLGVITTWARDATAKRKLEIAKKVLKLAAERYAIPEVPFEGTYPATILAGDRQDATARVAQAFAAIRRAFDVTGGLLAYRNDLFHGKVKVDGSNVQFIGTRPGQLNACDGEFNRQRQKVLWATLHLLSASGSLQLALTYLMQSESER